MFRNYIELKTAAFNSYAYYFTVPVGYTNLRAGTLFFCGEETPDIHIDNVSLVEVSQIPYTSWLTTSLAGGADAGSGVALGSLEHWYESDITTLGDSMWYSTSVSTSGTYEIFWNDFDDFNGYNDYAGDVVVSVYRTDGTTAYISSINRGYSTPIIVTPVQTTILIEVNAANASGGFAVGVHEQ
jgi:hypothetical protein